MMEKIRHFMFIRIFFLAVFSTLFLIPAKGQASDSASSKSSVSRSFGLFDDDDIIDVTLRFDMTTYLRKKPKDEFLKAEMIMSRGADSVKRNIRLKTRGKFRNSYCALAPIELNFKKVEFGFSDLDSISKLKLVNQCSWGTTNESYILREYLVYKMFSVLTDTSYRVRLLRLNFIDSGKDRRPMVQYGFFIEPDEMVGKRLNAVELKSAHLTQKHIYPYLMDRIAIFNYMIGNYDWSVPGPHNIKIFKSYSAANSQLAVAIPYDFDWTGVVNASYALPAENVGTDNVRERLFLGICRAENVFRSELDYFNRHKDDFYRIINDFQYLRPREKADITIFLNQFFDQLKGNKNNIVHTFRNSCKNF